MKLNIDEYNNYLKQSHREPFELRDGNGFVFISAPHSAGQTRNGRLKYAEPQTGVLAMMLHDELNCPVIFKTLNNNDDANYDKISPYKDAVLKYIADNKIKLLLDLHQLSPKRSVAIDLGIAKGKNIDNFDCLNVLLEEFSKQNVGIIQVDSPFCGSYPSNKPNGHKAYF